VEDTDALNNALLLERLRALPDERRAARYRCVVAYVAHATAVPEIVEATCEGYITTEPRGTGGFGYDPLFYATDLRMTFGEAPTAAKHRVSHRGRAFRALIEVLLRRAK
ncbi:MAG: non-canonical purine NTP pyrophosphatase, partial [Gemmatimonadetes bacterium]|nr:non-canonical purine NTP pyrophosphatase [Gemmatimonadota bacterium]